MSWPHCRGLGARFPLKPSGGRSRQGTLSRGRHGFQKVSGTSQPLWVFLRQAVGAISLLRLTAQIPSGCLQPNPSHRLLQTWVFVRWPLSCPSWRRSWPAPRISLLIIQNYGRSSSDSHPLPRIIFSPFIFVMNGLSLSPQGSCASRWFVLPLSGWRPVPRRFLARKSPCPFSMMKTSPKCCRFSGVSRLLSPSIRPLPMVSPCISNLGTQGVGLASGPASGSTIPPATSGLRLRFEVLRSTACA